MTIKKEYYQFFLEKTIKKIGHKFNLEIQKTSKTSPVDLTRYLDLHPTEATYMAGNKSALVRVSVSRCIHMAYLASPCTENTTSPFIKTLIDYQSGKIKNYHGSWLEVFYQSFCPNSAAEWMGLDLPNEHILSRQEAFGAPWFWVNTDMKTQLKIRQNNTNLENITHSDINIDYTHGNNMIGPVSKSKGNIEFQRLLKVYESIQKKGFNYNKNGFDNVSGVWLQSDNDWRLFIASGQHRIASAVVLGLPEIIVQIDPWGTGGVIKRCDTNHWTLVRNGILNKKESLFIFDRIFEKKPPLEAKEWINKIT